MLEFELLYSALNSEAEMDKATFELSLSYWQSKTYKKGDFFNEYKNICKHLGFIVEGIFRIYQVHEDTGEEKNMLFFSSHQFISSYKNFLNHGTRGYFIESLVNSTILYIHIDHLNLLYKQSHGWERFGRLIAEQAYDVVMTNTENLLFKTPEVRYLEMISQRPEIFNAVPLYHIASYLGIQGPSLSRIRKRITGSPQKNKQAINLITEVPIIIADNRTG